MSVTRKRNLVTGAPVRLVNLRRRSSVLKAAVVGLAPAPLRTLAHALDAAPNPAQVGSTSDALTRLLRWTGLATFSGPGAPKSKHRRLAQAGNT